MGERLLSSLKEESFIRLLFAGASSVTGEHEDYTL